MEHHRLAARRPLVELRQHRGDVLVREAVEAVAAHARVGQLLRQREHLRERRIGAVHRGVEAGDLRQLRRALRAARGSARGCAAGAAARAGRASRASRRTAASTRTGRGVVGAAVDDAMTDGGRAGGRRRTSPSASRAMYASAPSCPSFVARVPALLAHRLAGGVLRGEVRRGVDALDLPAGDERELARRAPRTART